MIIWELIDKKYLSGDHFRWQSSDNNCCTVWQQVDQRSGSKKKYQEELQTFVNLNFECQVLANDPSLEVIETREFTTDGQVMRLIHTMPKKPKIKSVRVYKRIN